jgi:hypothetical protein
VRLESHAPYFYRFAFRILHKIVALDAEESWWS